MSQERARVAGRVGARAACRAEEKGAWGPSYEGLYSEYLLHVDNDVEDSIVEEPQETGRCPTTVPELCCP